MIKKIKTKILLKKLFVNYEYFGGSDVTNVSLDGAKFRLRKIWIV